jgi:hypothetical protein
MSVILNNWTPDIELVLDHLRINSVLLSKEHKTRYFYLKQILQYFRLPIIVISGINSIISVGLQPYIPQGTISLINCLLSLSCSIIGSIELYLQINKQVEEEVVCSKEFYLLSIDIFKTLQLSPERRHPDPKAYLEDKYKSYCKLTETSHLLYKKIIDKLTPISDNINSITNSQNNPSPSPSNNNFSPLDIEL